MRLTLGDTPPSFTSRSGVTAERVDDAMSRLGPTIGYYGNVLLLSLDIESSRALMGAVQREFREEAGKKIMALLPQDGPLQPWQQRLLAFWTPVLQAQARQIKQTTDSQAAGKRKAKQRAAELAAAGNYVEVLQTIVDAKAGKAVDAARVAEAAKVVNEQKQADLAEAAKVVGAERRDNNR